MNYKTCKADTASNDRTLTNCSSNRYRVHKNLIGYGTDNEGLINMNVPPEYWSLDKYRATLGHKVNHSFKKPNTEFGNAIHPRFGPIRTIVATENIKRGEEILCDYAYSEESAIPIWYGKAYKEEYGEQWPGYYFYNETDDVNIYE